MQFQEHLTVPRKPLEKTPIAFSWLSLITPVLISAAIFVVTRSVLTLVFVVVAPCSMYLVTLAKRRAARRAVNAEITAYDAAVAHFKRQVREAHQRERDAWYRQHPDAVILGSWAQRSQLEVVGSDVAHTHDELRTFAHTNLAMPLGLHRNELQAFHSLDVRFEGRLGTQLKARFADFAPSSAEQFKTTRSPVSASEALGQRVLRLTRENGDLSANGVRGVKLEFQALGAHRRRLRAGNLSVNEPNQVEISPSDRSRLHMRLGSSLSGEEVSLDLVRDGPHALIAGTTGSGKSELLQTIIAELASTYSAEQVQFLLLDFKGGTALQHLAQLPHVVQLLTDLDGGRVRRAVSGLRAEIRRREQILRSQNTHDIALLGPEVNLARLVIVVDEFATLVSEHGELYSVFNDVGARGRALGMHLIIATQRPAGSVRDALAANCSLRFCLRVTSSAESVAVLGCDAAMELATQPAGTCVHSASGVLSKPWCVSRTGETLLSEVLIARSGDRVPDTPWHPELPRVLSSMDWPRMSPGVLYLGLSDEPDVQQQHRVTFSVGDAQPLLVFGAAGTGKTNLCASFAAQAARCDNLNVRYFGTDSAALWDMLDSADSRVERGDHRDEMRLWLFDDIDVAFERLGMEYAQPAALRLQTFLRELPASHGVVMTLTRIPAGLVTLLSGLGHRLFLPAAHKEQHVSWGLRVNQFDQSRPPGRALYRENEMQLPKSDFTLVPERSMVSGLTSDTSLCILAARPHNWHGWAIDAFGPENVRMLSDELRARAAESTVSNSKPSCVIGDLDEWMANTALLTPQSQHARVVFDGLTNTEIRTLTRKSQLPPPVSQRGQALMWEKNEGFSRVTRVHHPAP